MLMYRIQSVPDLTLSKYQVFADAGIDGMITAQVQFVKQLHRISLLGKVGIHFVYTYIPEKPDGKKIDILIMFSGISDMDSFNDKLRNIVKASGVSNYFSFDEVKAEFSFSETYTDLAFLIKKERVLQTSLNNQEQYFYVVPNWEMNEDARLYNLLKTMQAFDQKCCYRVDLYSQEDYEEEIHKSFERPLRYLRNISNKSNGISELSKIETEKRDPNADETLHQYEDWLKAIDQNPIYKCRIVAMSDDEQYSQLLLDSAATESVKSGGYTVKSVRGNFELFSYMDDSQISNFSESKKYHSEEAPNSLKKWPITYTSEEISAFARLPILYDGESIELPKETSPVHESDGIVIGKDTNGYEVRIPDKLFPKHMFVCGVPGSGKTNTMLLLANSLWNHTIIDKEGNKNKAHIPFLVLEPAKREYRELALFDIPELVIFSPSARTNFPIRINPFEFPLGLTLSEHINRLCQVFEGAFPIAPPAPFILDRSIQKIYENCGWNARDLNDGSKEYPTMSQLYDQFEIELKSTNYDSEIQGNIRSVLEMRIGSLLRREMKDMFDVRKSTLSPEEWLERPAIIELEALGEGPANFVTLLLCTLIRETLKANPYKDREKPVRHVIFIEEAHNLIAPESQVDDPQNSNPKIAATAYIVKMLAEVRALREGIIIADQLPTAMAPEVIKNTNVKLVHRLTSSDDRGLVGSTMSASPLQMENMATYTSGQALITYEKLLRPFEMQVDLVPEHGEKTPDDEDLFELMKCKNNYYNLRCKEENEKFELLNKQYIELVSFENKLIESENKLIERLKNIDPVALEVKSFYAWAETQRESINNLKRLAYDLLRYVDVINEAFFPISRKKELTDALKIVGCKLEKMVRKTVALL